MNRPRLVRALPCALLLIVLAACSAPSSEPTRSLEPASSSEPASPPAPPVESAETASSSATPAVLDALRARGIEVIGKFDAPAGLRGYAGAMAERPVALFVTPDGKYAIAGTLLDEQAEDISSDVVQEIVAGPVTERIWKQLESSHWIADGKSDAGRVVYTFSDPNCPYCNRFWHAARLWVDAGKVQLRHIMVGVIRADSAAKAAAMFDAPSPEKALLENESGFAKGGIQPASKVSPKVQGWLDENKELMGKLGFQGTPAMLFKDDEGELQTRSGLPQGQDLETVLGPR